MKPLYITGTQRDVGKTTLSIGLLHSFSQRGLRVGYAKPLGQRVKQVQGQQLHDDAVVVSMVLDGPDAENPEIAMSLTRGRVEKEIFDLKTPQLAQRVAEICEHLKRENDVVVIEGMGHVAMGSCLGISGADVARIAGARALLVAPGGIGSTIDQISLCSTFIAARGADFLGAVVNKVWSQKYTRIRKATIQGLENVGIRSYGTVPFEAQLSCPTMKQVCDLLGGELVGGEENLSNVIENTIVAAMESSRMVRYLKKSTLVITPGDRSDNILASLGAHALGDMASPTLAGLVLTGGCRPDGVCMRLIHEAHLPVLLVAEDTYAAASKFRQTVFKITPDDEQKISAAVCLMTEYVDVDGILESLQE